MNEHLATATLVGSLICAIVAAIAILNFLIEVIA